MPNSIGRILKNSSGDVLVSVNDNVIRPYEADSSIDPNITESNIKKGVTILGVTGTYMGNVESITTSQIYALFT